jgi:hypothetical protein
MTTPNGDVIAEASGDPERPAAAGRDHPTGARVGSVGVTVAMQPGSGPAPARTCA